MLVSGGNDHSFKDRETRATAGISNKANKGCSLTGNPFTAPTPMIAAKFAAAIQWERQKGQASI